MQRVPCAMTVLLFTVPAWGQETIELQAVPVAGHIYMIRGTDDGTSFSGGNIAVSVGEDGVLMVDSKMEPLGAQILEAIEKLGGTRPKYLLNTHVHGDHTGGNANFADGTVIAHTNVRKRLVGKDPKERWPVITFDTTLTVHFNGEEITAVHFPSGHTDGDLVVFFTGSNVVHIGDLMFAGLFPFVDLDNGGSVAHYMENVKSVIDQVGDDVQIIPGHGPLSTRANLRTYWRMLQETTAYVRQQMQAGKKLEEIKAAGLPSEWQSYSWQFVPTEKWVETIYQSYESGGG